jgi:hypothetical protein
VHDDVEQLRAFAERLYRHREAFGPLPARATARHPLGFLHSPRDDDALAAEVPTSRRRTASAASSRGPTAERVAWTGLYLDPLGRGWMVSCVAPVRLPGGAVYAVVGLDVTVARLAERLEAPAGEALLLVSGCWTSSSAWGP